MNADDIKITKKSLGHCRRITVERVNHPGFKEEDDGTITYRMHYLPKNSSQRKSAECSQEVFTRVYGRHPKGDVNSLPVGGWATSIGKYFYLYLTEKNGKPFIEAISAIPGLFYRSAGSAPTQLRGNRNLELDLFPKTGECAVTWFKFADDGEGELPKIPPGLSDTEFGEIIAALDKSSSLVVGQHLANQWHISSILGNKIVISK